MRLIRVQNKNAFCLIKNVAYDDAHSMMEEALRDAPLRFAKRRVTLNELIWELPEGEWFSLAEATPAEQQAAQVLIQAQLPLVEQALSSLPHPAETAANAITVPGLDFIFFRPVGSGVELVLTGWAYRKLSAPIVPPSVCNVRLGFRRDGQPLPQHAFTVATEHGARQLLTDSAGQCRLGGVEAGTVLNLECEGEVFTLTVAKTADVFWFDLKSKVVPPPPEDPPAATFDGAVCVVSAEGVPVAGHVLTFHGTSGDQQLTTDAAGRVDLTGLTEGVQLSFTDSAVPPTRFTATFTAAAPVVTHQLPPEVPPFRMLRFTFVDTGGRPLSALPVSLTQTGRQPVTATLDAAGKIDVDPAALVTDKPVRLTVACAKRKFAPVDFNLAPGETDYTVQVTPRKQGGTLRAVLLAVVLLAAAGAAYYFLGHYLQFF